MRKWSEEVDRFQGDGELSDDKGHIVPVEYTLIVEQDVREQDSFSGPIRTRGHYKLSGVLQRSPQAGFVDLTSDRLTLKLEDGRSVQVLPTRVGGPLNPVPFKANGDDSFVPRSP